MAEPLEFRPLDAGHVEAIVLAERFAGFAQVKGSPGAVDYLTGYSGVAAFAGGVVVAIGGLLPGLCGLNAQIWMAGAESLRPRHYPALTGEAARLVGSAHCQGIARVEAYVPTAWPAAHRWIRRLGFGREGTMRRFGAAGEDFDLYAHLEEAAPCTA